MKWGDFTKTLISGSNTTLGRLGVELFWLALSAVLSTYVAYFTKNPGIFPGEWMAIIRLILGLATNLVNQNIPNT